MDPLETACGPTEDARASWLLLEATLVAISNPSHGTKSTTSRFPFTSEKAKRDLSSCRARGFLIRVLGTVAVFSSSWYCAACFLIAARELNVIPKKPHGAWAH